MHIHGVVALAVFQHRGIRVLGIDQKTPVPLGRGHMLSQRAHDDRVRGLPGPAGNLRLIAETAIGRTH